MNVKPRSDVLIPLGLFMPGVVPIVAGMMRLQQMAVGTATQENARFLASPWPVSLHIVCASLFCVLGPLQFSSGFRRRQPLWHRMSGWILVPCGFAVSWTGLWMTQFYPSYGFDGPALYWIRLIVGILMSAALWTATSAIIKRDIPRHRIWMIRAYALALGAGTQVITHLPWFLFPELRTELFRTIFMGAGWAINMAVAEWIIWQSQRHQPWQSAHTGVNQGQPL